MARSAASVSRVLPVTEEAFLEIGVVVLRGLQYVIDDSNDRLQQISANCSHSEQHGRDMWRYRFNAQMSWRRVDQGLEITVSITESQSPTQINECKRRCEEICSALEAAVEQVNQRSQSECPRTTNGSAAWATRDELIAAGYLPDVTADFADRSGRFLVGRVGDTDLLITEEHTHRHVLICGPTGCGKSSGIFIPNLIERLGTSAIVTEATAGSVIPNLYKNTAGWRALSGQEIFYFNQNDPASTRMNPLDMVQSFDDAIHIANLIVLNSTLPNNVADQIWQQSETHLLTALIWHTCGERRGKDLACEGDNANLGFIRRLLRLGPQGIGAQLTSSKRELARLEYFAFLKNTSPNFRFGVVSGLMQRLNLWTSPKVQALTAVTDFCPSDLGRKLFTFYLATSIHRPEDKPLAALMFNFVLDLVLQQEFEHPLTLLLDEFANYGYIPAFPDKLTVIRNRKIGVVLGIQDFVQLKKVYREDDAKLLFTQPGTRIFFRPQDSFTAQRISLDLGYSTLYTRKVNSRGHVDEREQPRLLLDSSEVIRLPQDKIIVFLPATNPVVATKFHWKDHLEATQVSPPDRPEQPTEAVGDSFVEPESFQSPDQKPETEMEVPDNGTSPDSGDKKTASDKTVRSKAPPTPESPWHDQQDDSGVDGSSDWTDDELVQYESEISHSWTSDDWPEGHPSSQ
jgi:type IV secretory pathway TraG/TraD family ATPase VirD4